MVARTVELPGVPDLIAIGGRPGGTLWQHDDRGLAGVGTALHIRLPRGLDGDEDVRTVLDSLQALSIDDPVGLPGCGPVVLGALPFDRSAPTGLVVPRWIVGRRGATSWLTSIAPADQVHDDPLGVLRALESGGPAGEPPDGFSLTPAMSHGDWRHLVADAVATIRAGALAKVVLTRKVDVTANRPFVIPDVLARLAALYPVCMVFHADGFVGASPELLVERLGERVRSYPLAGTVARSGDVTADQRLVDALIASTKDRSEHRFVVDALTRALEPLCAELDVPDHPEVLALRNVSHLATPISGRLLAGGPPGNGHGPPPAPSALDLVARVQPTPAVAGTPTAAAIAYLQRVEGFDRGTFAGPVGWMDHRGDGAWAIGIRSAHVSAAGASMYAGVGVVADSDPVAELAETQLKLQALLAALVRP
ncbi:MAG TPA: isochorismate synthase [Acidimicrobiales bacterium]|nr:isochorismate synthase [Acidimicrobiales bacterium]